ITRFRDDSAADVIYATAPTVPTAPAAVPVLFQLNRRCAFGDAWGVCGSSPSLGSWDLTKAVPLKWTPGDLWCGLTFLPDTSPVEFKFVLLDARNGYKPKGWANDVSGPANLRMDVRRSGCLLTRGQAQAYAATPELSTELALPVKEFLSSSLAASPYTSDIPDTPAGLLSIEPGADAVDATFTLPGLDPIELAVAQGSGHTPLSLTTEDVLPSAVDITPAAFHQVELSGPDTEAIPADAPLYFEPTISDTPSTPAVREEVGSSQDPSIYKALEDQVAQRHALDGDRGAVLPTPPPDGNTSGPGTDVVPEPEACVGVTDASTQSEAHGEHVVMPEFVEDSTINSITEVLAQAASALQDVVGEPTKDGAEAGVEQEQLPNAHEAPTTDVSAVTGSSGISPRNSPIVMAASLVAHGILPSPVQLEQRVVQAGGQSLAPRNRMARPFSSRGRISPVNFSSAMAARLYQDMFGISSLSISHRPPALSTAMPASAIDAASANMDIHEVPEEVESGLESSLAAVPEQNAGDAAEHAVKQPASTVPSPSLLRRNGNGCGGLVWQRGVRQLSQ
ncbi:CBM20 domain-containing protein, partial [Haematococcus lacustris]